MPNKMIVLADLGRLKAFRVSRDEMSTTPRVELVDEVEFMDAHGRLLDKVTDKAGRFPSADGTGMSIGENHNLHSEVQKRLIKRLGEGINGLVKREDPPVWHFAAAKEINQKIVDELSGDVRSRMTKNVGSDLTKVTKSELLSYFVS